MSLPYSAESQSIGLVGVGNARELGGYLTPDGRAVRRGVLLRSAVPVGATDQDKRRLREVYNLTLVLDLRMSYERATSTPTNLSFATVRPVCVLDEERMMRELREASALIDEDASPATMITMAVDQGIVSDTMFVDFLESECGKRGYATVLRILLAQPADEALLFHCTQGKDRTGIAAMLILSALGVGEETILFDFLLTNTFNAELIARERRMLADYGIAEAEVDRYMHGFDQVFASTMRTALEHLAREYGSVWGYINRELAIGADERAELRRKYLTAPA
jgi:protein-tyrosine phosphatase